MIGKTMSSCAHLDRRSMDSALNVLACHSIVAERFPSAACSRVGVGSNLFLRLEPSRVIALSISSIKCHF